MYGKAGSEIGILLLEARWYQCHLWCMEEGMEMREEGNADNADIATLWNPVP